MFTYQIIVEYIGTNLVGWQTQKNGLSVQEVLDMPVSHYNLWLAYLKKEQDEYKTQQRLSKIRN